jgi:hypothetical protein
MKISLEILKSKQMGPLCRGTMAAGQIPATRFADGEGRGWERQEGTKPHLIVALGGKVVDWGGSPVWQRADGCWGGGGGASVRERARGPVVQCHNRFLKGKMECITICMPGSSSIRIVTSSMNNQQQYHEKRIKKL